MNALISPAVRLSGGGCVAQKKKKNSHNLFLSIHRQKTALQVFLFTTKITSFFLIHYTNTEKGKNLT